MRIVFGIKSMKYKTFHGDDDKLNFLLVNNDSLEVRQEYFHLYFIPVFPLTKQYSIVSKNGLKRDATEAEFESIRESSIPHKFPLLSFSFPFLIVLGLLAYYLITNVDHFLAERNNEKQLKEYYSRLRVDLNRAQKNDILIFYKSRVPASEVNSEEEQEWMNYDLMKIGAWVKERKGNQFTICFIEDGTIDFNSLNQKDLDKIPDLPYLKECDVQMNLSDLESAIPKEALLFFQPHKAVVQLGNKEGYYSLDKIVGIRLPKPEVMMAQGLESNGKYILMNLANMGVDAQIEEIRTIYGNLDWKEKFPKDFPECSRDNGCSIQLGATFKKDISPIQVAKMKLNYGEGNWITYLIMVNNEDINLIEIYKN